MAIWMLVVVDYAMEVFQGFHYSIDMVLGMVICRLLYRVMEPWGVSVGSQDKALQDPWSHRSSWKVVGKKEWVIYSVPACVCVWMIVWKPMNVNLGLVGLAVGSVVMFLKGNVGYAKHLSVCLLFLAVAVYL